MLPTTPSLATGQGSTLNPPPIVPTGLKNNYPPRQPWVEFENPLTVPKAHAESPISPQPLSSNYKIKSDDIKQWREQGQGKNDGAIFSAAYGIDPAFKESVDRMKEYNSSQSKEWNDSFPTWALNQQYAKDEIPKPDKVTEALLQHVHTTSTQTEKHWWQGISDMVNAPGDLATGLIDKGLSGMGLTMASQTREAQNIGSNAAKVRDNIPNYAAMVAAPFTGGMSWMGGAAALGGVSAAGQAVTEGIKDVQGVNDASLGQQAKNVATQGMYGAASEIGGRILGKGLSYIGSKLAAPFADTFKPEVKQLADQYGIQLPASAMTDSKIVPAVEAVEGKSLLGGKIPQMVDTAQSQIEDIGKGLAGPEQHMGQLGIDITKGFKDYSSSFNETKNALYDIADKELQNGKLLLNSAPDVSEPVSYLEKIMGNKKLASEILPNVEGKDVLADIKANLDALSNSNPNSKDVIGILRSTITELGQKIEDMGGYQIGNRDPLTKAYVGLQSTLQDSLDNYLTTSLGANHPAVEALNNAKSFYKAGIQNINSHFGDIIDKNITDPSVIADRLIQPKRPDQIPAILETIGPENANSLRSYWMHKAIDTSTNAGQNPLSGARLNGFIKKYGADTLKNLLTPEQFKGLMDLRTLATAVDKGQAMAKGSQTAFLAKVMAEATLIFTHPITLLKVLVGDVALSKILSSPVGIQWLTEGFKPVLPEVMSPAKEAIGGIGKAALKKGMESVEIPQKSVGKESLHQLNIQ